MQVRTYTSHVTAAGVRCPAAVLPRIGLAVGLRHASDLWLIFGTLAFATAVFVWPNLFTIGIGIWWLLNTVSHNFIHQPFFNLRAANRLFGMYLSLITLVPQRLWRDKHFAHHADRPWRFHCSSEMFLQLLLIAVAWGASLVATPRFALFALVPGFLLAMALCSLHGYFEHASGTTSHYSHLYNRFFFNDGFHVEHHEHPGVHWTALPSLRDNSRSSRWPAILRWCDWFNLNGLEALVIRSPILQRWVVSAHEKAVRDLTAHFRVPKQVAIIGGGLFPRSAIVVHKVWPKAKVCIIDANRQHLETCRSWLRGDETMVCARVTPNTLPEAEIIFVPLAFDQDKRPLYDAPKNGCIIVHDWIWNQPKEGNSVHTAIASIFLLKRLNLVSR
jgi:hypothetical protein